MTAERAPRPKPKPKVICLDDDLAVAQMVGDVVDFCGCEPIVLTNAYDVPTHLGDPEVKALITDYMMPRLTGLEVLYLTQERRPDVRRVIITAAPNESAVREALVGKLAQMVIAKPPTIADIKTAVAWLDA